jgi:CRISPR system Cascade subunit CasE
MYMSRISLKSDANKNPAFWRSLEDIYKMHRVLWSLFADSDDRKRDFLYRCEEKRGAVVFFDVSDREPHDTRGLWHIESKSYQPQLNAGQRLTFVLRANPIRSKKDADKRQHRHDVIMEAKTRLKQAGQLEGDRPPENEIVQEEGYRWLATRALQYGFAVNEAEVRVDGYRQHRFLKPKGSHQVRFSTIEITGMLTVADPELFREALNHGVGPAKGFGCGLMLVRRV